MADILDASSKPDEAASAPERLAISLSGGGYRAMLFSAGALLAVADSAMRKRVVSINSVSGGSIASAVTVGGFADPSTKDPDPMARRVRLLCGLAQSSAIASQSYLGLIGTFCVGLGAIIILSFLLPAMSSTPEGRLMIGKAALGALVLATAFFVIALVHSWYTIQSVVESLVAAARSGHDRRAGTTLDDLAAEEPTLTRIFCATDLETGSHVYMSPTRVLVAHDEGDEPNVFLGDVVAASACFPGFRPVAFGVDELGLAPRTANRAPRRRRNGTRIVLGLLGTAGLVAALAAVGLRIVGAFGDGWLGFGTALALFAVGSLVTYLCAKALASRDRLVLMDGGICDNLGAAFALLARDHRYPALPGLAGLDTGGLMLVVDASKPFTPSDRRGNRRIPRLARLFRDFISLIPLRLRGAQRSALSLLGNANGVARKHVIETALEAGGPVFGTVVSITEVPDDAEALAQAVPPPGGEEVNAATRIDRQPVDWPTVVPTVTAVTPTTLDALPQGTVWALVLQGYRLTQSRLAGLGVPPDRVRTDQEIRDLAPRLGAERPDDKSARILRLQYPRNEEVRRLAPDPAADAVKIVQEGQGPYARQSRRSDAVAGALSLVAAISGIIAIILLL